MPSITSLTPREHDVLRLLARGNHNKEIAQTLGIAEHTVENHLKHIYRKLAVQNRVEAALTYWKLGGDPRDDGNPLYTSG